MSNLWMDDGQQDPWYGQGQESTQAGMNWGQFDYSQQQAPTQQYTHDQGYYQQQSPYTQPQSYYGAQMFIPNSGMAVLVAPPGDGEDYENEPPLLEELGINFSHIKEKTFAVLNPAGSASPEVIEDQDLAGPLVFCLLFGFALLLHGKMTFGYIYGIGGLGCVGMYALMNLMAGDKSISFVCTASVLGYCLLPMALLSMVTAVFSFKVDMKKVYGETDEHRCFLNVCHCEELPPPTDDIDEDQLAERIDRGDLGYRIPVSIGELDSIVDSKNRNQPKIDVLVNSVFYEKRLAPPAANFFRHFFCMVVCDAVEEKHHLKLDPNKCIKLKNRTVMGSIEPMKIVKRPVAPVIQEIAASTATEDTQILSFPQTQQPPGVRIRLLKGTHLEVELNLKQIEGLSASRLRLRINRDRIVLLVDNTRSLYDFCIPFLMDPTTVRHKLNQDSSKLVFSVSVVYS